MGVKRTTIELDEDQLRMAQEALGTTGIKDTVEESLARVVRVHAYRKLRANIAASDYADRPDDIRRDATRDVDAMVRPRVSG